METGEYSWIYIQERGVGALYPCKVDLTSQRWLYFDGYSISIERTSEQAKQNPEETVLVKSFLFIWILVKTELQLVSVKQKYFRDLDPNLMKMQKNCFPRLIMIIKVQTYKKYSHLTLSCSYLYLNIKMKSEATVRSWVFETVTRAGYYLLP